MTDFAQHGPMSFSAGPAERRDGGEPSAFLSPLMRRMRSRERLQFRLIFAVTYPLFLVVAMVQTLVPAARNAFAVEGPVRGSVFRRAAVLANSTIPFAFMG
jgi:hypothetical protein